MHWCRCTYDYYRRHEGGVHEEIAGLREPRRLALKHAAVLVEEVRVHEDGELGLRDEERREEAPDLRPYLRGEDEGLVECVGAQADDASVAEARDGECESRNRPARSC